MRYTNSGEQYDVTIRNIKFDSYLKLHERIRGDKELEHTATLYYDGSDIVGDVGIRFARYAEQKDKDTVIELLCILKTFD